MTTIYILAIQFLTSCKNMRKSLLSTHMINISTICSSSVRTCKTSLALIHCSAAPAPKNSTRSSWLSTSNWTARIKCLNVLIAFASSNGIIFLRIMSLNNALKLLRKSSRTRRKPLRIWRSSLRGLKVPNMKTTARTGWSMMTTLISESPRNCSQWDTREEKALLRASEPIEKLQEMLLPQGTEKLEGLSLTGPAPSAEIEKRWSGSRGGDL